MGLRKQQRIVWWFWVSIEIVKTLLLVAIIGILMWISEELIHRRPVTTEVHNHYYTISHKGILNLYDEQYAKIQEGGNDDNL